MVHSISILIIVLNISFIVGNNYCEYENKLCENQMHVACHKNNFTHPQNLTNFQMFKVDLPTKNFILDKINDFRNKVAYGEYRHNLRMDQASNMRLMNWDDDLSHVAEQAALKLSSQDYKCVKSLKYPNAVEIDSIVSGESRDEETVFNIFLSEIIKLSLEGSPQWSLLYVANNSRIGCAYAKYDDNTKPMYSVKCITNENDVKVVKEAYKEMAKGHCKKCNEWNEPCNVVHMGLCGKHELQLSMQAYNLLQKANEDRKRANSGGIKTPSQVLLYISLVLIMTKK